MRIVVARRLEVYVAKDGKKPFLEWLELLADKKLRYKIKERLDRVALGNFGDYKMIVNGNGIAEFRLHVGPGYRIYFGEQHKKIIILLCGGSKNSQKKDIVKAKMYWQDYLEEEK